MMSNATIHEPSAANYAASQNLYKPYMRTSDLSEIPRTNVKIPSGALLTHGLSPVNKAPLTPRRGRFRAWRGATD